MRIISLVPSITELLFDLGLENQIVGRTKFCVHPKEKVQQIQQLGGTKMLHLDKIKQLKPDLIIANKEENTREQILELQPNFNVVITEVKTLQDNNEMILGIGNQTNSLEKAEAMVSNILQEFCCIPKKEILPSALYLIWNEPLMSVGNDTFIHEMLRYAGFENVCSHLNRYPAIKSHDYEPEFVLLSSEPFPFSEKHIQHIQRKFPASKILLVDGEMFSWYGSRMRLAPTYFKSLRASINQ